MLRHAQSLVGKPFSNLGMVRSVIYPRKTDGKSFFCAGERSTKYFFVHYSDPVCCRTELVASILKCGGLMSKWSNPGSATPQSLHALYKNQAAVTANPYTLRTFSSLRDTSVKVESRQDFKNLFNIPTKKNDSKYRHVQTKKGNATFHCLSTSSSSTSYTD